MTDYEQVPQVYDPEKHPLEDIPSNPPVYMPGTYTPAPDPISPEPATEFPVEEPKKKRHVGLIILIVLLVLIAGLGIFAYSQYKPIMAVIDELTADGNVIAENARTLADSARELDFETSLTAATTIDERAHHMLDLISTPRFDLLSHVPKYGKDVLTARKLLELVIDADENAAIPVLKAAVDHPLEGLYSSKTGLDVDGLYAIVDAIDAALPIAERDIDELAALDSFEIPQLKETLAPVFDNIGTIKETFDAIRTKYDIYRPMVDSMIGRDGSGTVASLLGMAGPILGDRADILYQSLISYLKSMITGASLTSDGVDWDPIIKKFMNGEEVGIFDIMQLIFSADDELDEGADAGMDLFWLLSLLFGGGSDDSGDSGLDIFSILGLLFGGDDGGEGGSSDSGDSGFDIFSILGLLFGDGEGEGGSSEGDSGTSEDSGFDIISILDLLFGEGEGEGEGEGGSPDGGSDAAEDSGFDILELLELFLGDEDGSSEDGEGGEDSGLDIFSILGLLLGSEEGEYAA